MRTVLRADVGDGSQGDGAAAAGDRATGIDAEVANLCVTHLKITGVAIGENGSTRIDETCEGDEVVIA